MYISRYVCVVCVCVSVRSCEGEKEARTQTSAGTRPRRALCILTKSLVSSWSHEDVLRGLKSRSAVIRPVFWKGSQWCWERLAEARKQTGRRRLARADRLEKGRGARCRRRGSWFDGGGVWRRGGVRERAVAPGVGPEGLALPFTGVWLEEQRSFGCRVVGDSGKRWVLHL